MTQRVTLPGSAKAAPGTEVPVRLGDRLDGQFEVTLVLRRRADLPRELVAGPETLSRARLAEAHGAHPDDMQLVADVIRQHGGVVSGSHPGSRRVHAIVSPAVAEELFGVHVREASSADWAARPVRHRDHDGPVHVPVELDGVVEAVLGLDARPHAVPHFHTRASVSSSYTPLEVAGAYGFAHDDAAGSGQTIAIIELGGGFDPADMDAYFRGLGVTPPKVSSVGVDGGRNKSDGPNGADGEVQLDIEVAGAVAPGANIVVYFAPNTDQGFLDAVSEAAHANPTPAAISISWGAAEVGWSKSAMKAFDAALQDAAALGVTVTAASGDSGSGDGSRGKNVDFPASSPHALGCGGTNLALAGDGTIKAEKVWYEGPSEGTGGGVSTVFAAPDYQKAAGISGSGRSVPDVAGDADPASGYQVAIDGEPGVIGGTSAVAPLWAGIVARVAQSTGKPVGLAHTALYAAAKAGQAAPGFHDVTSGSNGAYKAAVGYDCCTGLGTPDGANLVALFGATTTDPGQPGDPGGGQNPPPSNPPGDNLLQEIEAYLEAEFAKIKTWLQQLFGA